jgi:hypothetical protein
MKILESFLLDNNKTFFGFAYSLLSDDLQAQQAVIDSVYVMTIKRTDLLEKLYLDIEKKIQDDAKVQIKKYVLMQIFNICQKRITHLKSSILQDETYPAFYRMSFNNRAILYLKYKAQIAFSEISEIIGVNEFELMGLLSSAQKNLVENLDLKQEHVFA